MKQIRIMVIDPRQLIREGFERLLRRPLFSVVTTGGTLEDAFNSADMAQADVVVLSHSTEAEVQEQIAALRHRTADPHRPRFVLVTEIEEPDLLRQALEAGVDALLSKDISSRVLQRSLELVALGQRLFPVSLLHPAPDGSQSTVPSSAAPGRATPDTTEPEPKAAPGLITVSAPLVSAKPRFEAQPPSARPDAASPGPHERTALSARESQILEYLVRAYSNKAIALELKITEATVKVHIKALLRKIRASNRTQAAIWALSLRTMPNQAAEIADLPVAGMADRHVTV